MRVVQRLAGREAQERDLLLADTCIGCDFSEQDYPFPVLSVDCPVHGDEAKRLTVEAIDAGTVIQRTPDGRCELCGEVEETRPYGPNGEEVCFTCMKKDEAAAKRTFDARMGRA
jgi:hypothetical protein